MCNNYLISSTLDYNRLMECLRSKEFRIFGRLNLDTQRKSQQNIELAILKFHDGVVSFVFTATDFDKVIQPIRSRTICIETEKELEQQIEKIKQEK